MTATPAAPARALAVPQGGPQPHGSDELFRRLVDGVRDYAIFVLTPDGHIATWNAGAERIKGYTAAEAVGRHFSMFYPPADVERGWPDEELRRAAALGRFEDEGWRVRKDGSRFWANVVISPVRGAAGELLGYSKVTRDLTERRRWEDQLREREENLRLLVDGVRDHAMFLLDAAGRIRTWNDGAARTLGHAAAQAIGQDAALLYTPEDRAAARPQADLTAARTGEFHRTEGWRLRADGSPLWAETSITALHEPGGDVRGFVQIVRDLSDRRRIESLESEGRRTGEFIAMLSHELRNPLAPIRNAVALLGQGADAQQAAWATGLIARQTAHLSRLVDDLLDVSRITSGKFRLKSGPQELGALVRQAVDASRADLDARGHRLDLRLAPTPVPVVGDETRLTQVVVNLLHNAAKYTPDGGRVSVTLEVAGGHATLQVADDGVGMAPSLLERAFDPFVQGTRALDRSGGGLGVGLTLVKSIVELHGGRIAAASAGPGQGTTMTVTLPLAPAAPASPAPPAAHGAHPAPARPGADPAAAAPARAVPALVLVVDDNVDAAESLALLLRLSGHRVEVAHDGAAALRQALLSRPQVVLLDLGLPDIDGYEVARRLRAEPALQGVRLIAVTGFGQASDRDATAQAGFTAHLTKPVDPDELTRLIAG